MPEERLYIKGKENVTLTRYNVLVLGQHRQWEMKGMCIWLS